MDTKTMDVEGLPGKVERFNVTCYYTDEGHPEATMFPSPIGAYVLYSDYTAQCRAKGAESDEAHAIHRLDTLLREIAVIVKGAEPPLTRWSYHDLPELVRALASKPAASVVDDAMARRLMHALPLGCAGLVNVDAATHALTAALTKGDTK